MPTQAATRPPLIALARDRPRQPGHRIRAFKTSRRNCLARSINPMPERFIIIPFMRTHLRLHRTPGNPPDPIRRVPMTIMILATFAVLALALGAAHDANLAFARAAQRQVGQR